MIDFLSLNENANKSFTFYDWLVRDFLYFLLLKKNTTLFMPGINDNINIGDSWESKANTAYTRAVDACEFESSNNHALASYKWQLIFGSDYPSS
jgi:hypothetical protein